MLIDLGGRSRHLVGVLGRRLLGRGLLGRSLLLGRALLRRLRLLGLLVPGQAVTRGAPPEHVGVRLLEGGGRPLGRHTEDTTQVEHLGVGHPELFCEFVDPDLLRWHASIQPFPVVIPSGAAEYVIGSAGRRPRREMVPQRASFVLVE